MTERRSRLSDMLGDTLARLTADSSVTSVVAYLQDYERLVLDRGMSPDGLVPAETDVQAIFRLIQELRGLAVDVPQTSARDRFMHQVAIARADYLTEKARQSARRNKANGIAAGVAAVCILAATASVAGATSGLPKVTLPFSLHDIVDSISPAKSSDSGPSDAAPASLPPPAASSALTDAVGEKANISADGLTGIAELRQLLETLQSGLLDEQSISPTAPGDVTSGPDSSKPQAPAPVAPNSASSTQGASGPSAAPGRFTQSGAPGSVLTQAEPPATQRAGPPVDTQPASGNSESTGGQSASAPGVTGTTPGQTGSTPGQGGAGGSLTGSAPGLTGSTPGLDGSAPGLSGSTPVGPSGANPGQSGSAPGTSGASPGQSGSAPGTSGSAPGTSGSTSGDSSIAPGNSASANGQSGSAHGASDSNAGH